VILVAIATNVTVRNSEYTWLSCTNIVFTLLHVIIQPFNTPRDNFNETISLTVLSLITTVLTTFSIPLSYEHGILVSLLLFVPGGLFFLHFLLPRLQKVARPLSQTFPRLRRFLPKKATEPDSDAISGQQLPASPTEIEMNVLTSKSPITVGLGSSSDAILSQIEASARSVPEDDSEPSPDRRRPAPLSALAVGVPLVAHTVTSRIASIDQAGQVDFNGSGASDQSSQTEENGLSHPSLHAPPADSADETSNHLAIWTEHLDRIGGMIDHIGHVVAPGHSPD